MEALKKSGSAGTETPTKEKSQVHFNPNGKECQALSDVEAVTLIRAEYPGFDRSLWSKSKKPEYYGIKLVLGARQIVDATGPRRKDNRRKQHRLSFRTTNDVHRRLQKAKQRLCIASNQTLLENIIIQWLEEVENRVS